MRLRRGSRAPVGTMGAAMQRTQQMSETVRQLQARQQQLDAYLAPARAEAAAARAAAAPGDAGGQLPRAQAAASVGVGTRLLGNPSDFSEEKSAWRDRGAVFRGYAGAAVPRLSTFMKSAADSTTPVPNVTLTEQTDA